MCVAGLAIVMIFSKLTLIPPMRAVLWCDVLLLYCAAVEIKAVKAKEEALRAVTTGSGGGALSEAVQELPALLQRKARLTAHTR